MLPSSLSGERRRDDLIDRLILDIKALVLLEGSEVELKAHLDRKLGENQDPTIKSFVSALQRGEKPSGRRLFAIAVGEMLVASLLVIAGIIILVPTVVGISTPAGLVQYFAEKVYGEIGASQISQYVSAVEFAVGAALMLSAFFALREAALSLKKVGISVRSAE